MLQLESEWCWHIVELTSGTHQVRFTGKAAYPTPRIGLWAWDEYNLSGKKIPLPEKASQSAMPQYRDEIEREGICILRP